MKRFFDSPMFVYHRKFLFCFVVVLASRIFYYDWWSWSLHYATWILKPLSLLFLIFLPIHAVNVLHTRYCRCLLLRLLLLFLPLRQGYETMRFSVLQPMMENVAVALAQTHQSDTLRSTRYKPIDLPFPQRLLSRGGCAFLIPNDEGIAVAYVKSNGSAIMRTSYYTYQTNVPYRGKSAESYCGEKIKRAWPLGGDWNYSEGYAILENSPDYF